MSTIETATFAAGCFWGVQYQFDQLQGVIETSVGYTGGHLENPNYKKVCSDTTGHAEAVQVKFDPKLVSYEELLKLFWQCHNPTEHNRQGVDVGSQYRSVIFYHNDTQEKCALQSKAALEQANKYQKPIATSIETASTFYRAEEYHQKYLEKHGRGSCHV